ncbi:MAG: carbamoyl-phosphate synthase large subunit [Cyanobacteria bacterium SZAS-4]|nr:carbamoyl-phosphate synthase large subunit [Cyanobacteria bacterium SZAS-4]
MPKRSDLTKVLVLGAGPIRIGQACEFDYSGTQACKALKDEGYEVILVNSNPATIMTDPGRATKTYIEPLTAADVRKIIEIERPDALLPTVGGQTALNVAVDLANSGCLEELGVELIGASLESIEVAEDRELFKAKMIEIGMPLPKSATIQSLDSIHEIAKELGFPVIVRPAFTLGGSGSGIAHSEAELVRVCEDGLQASPVGKVLLEESIVGWKELEFEVVRDKADNFIVVCTIENIDPMGIHTGDSITVAPVQTLSDPEFQVLREASKKIIRAVGIDCGGSNIQFAINPVTGQFVVIEMNPRVSRSSALASKATGYPIAKIAAKLAVGLTLDEIRNDIVGDVSACFEPVLDYVVTKLPRFEFGKFSGSSEILGTQMKSVGESMGIGSTFQESLQKAFRSLELGVNGFAQIPGRVSADKNVWKERMTERSRFRLIDVWGAFNAGFTVEEIKELSAFDGWFLDNLHEIFVIDRRLGQMARTSSGNVLELLTRDELTGLKAMGFGDAQIAKIFAEHDPSVTEDAIFALRQALDVQPSYRKVDTCASEFPTTSNYMYSSYGAEDSEEVLSEDSSEKVIILGSGPNRIGQGIEFDYCCVQASLCLKERGLTPIMVNCNPETVSTDYDVSSKLYFEPITLEDVSNIVLREGNPGIIIQMGGQTPLKLASALKARGYKLLGTSVDSINLAEDRDAFIGLLNRLGLKRPAGAVAYSVQEATSVASTIGYPVLIRPSYVLGGRAMQVVHGPEQLQKFLNAGFAAAAGVLIDRFLIDAIEVDVDAISDGVDTVIAGVMEHVEQAGIHSGDSSCFLPPQSLSTHMVEQMIAITKAIAAELSVKGFLNIQFAVQNDEVYVIEANPRASRTIPFVSKASGIPWSSIGTRVIMGESVASLSHLWKERAACVAVKSPVLPFDKFRQSAIALGPEMRSTGEVMGIANESCCAFAKAQSGANRETRNAKSVIFSATAECLSQAADLITQYSSLGLKMFITDTLSNSLFAPHLNVLDTSTMESARAGLQANNIDLIVSLSLIDGLETREHNLRRAGIDLGKVVTVSMAEAKQIGISIHCGQVHNAPPVSLQDLHAQGSLSFVPPAKNLATT